MFYICDLSREKDTILQKTGFENMCFKSFMLFSKNKCIHHLFYQCSCSWYYVGLSEQAASIHGTFAILTTISTFPGLYMEMVIKIKSKHNGATLQALWYLGDSLKREMDRLYPDGTKSILPKFHDSTLFAWQVTYGFSQLRDYHRKVLNSSSYYWCVLYLHPSKT